MPNVYTLIGELDRHDDNNVQAARIYGSGVLWACIEIPQTAGCALLKAGSLSDGLCT